MGYLFDILIFFPAVICFHHIICEMGVSAGSKIRRTTIWMALAIFIMAFSDAMFIMGASANDINFLLFTRLLCSVVLPTIPILGFFVACTMLRFDYQKANLDYLIAIPLLWLTAVVTFVMFLGWDNIVEYEKTVIALRHYSLGVGADSPLPVAEQDSLQLWYSRLFGTFFSWSCTLEWFLVFCFIVVQLFKQRRTRFEFFSFLFKGGESTQFYVFSCWMLPVLGVTMVRLTLGLPFLKEHPWLAIVYATVTALCLVNALYSATIDYLPTITFKAIASPWYQETVTTDRVVDAPVINLATSNQVQDVSTSYDILMNSMDKLMHEEMLFLQANLAIEDVAAELSTNRVYVSRAVNQIKHMTFREYLTELRVDYAKQYIRLHPEATQEIIASQCGFNDASAFNRKFRIVTGLSPREWALSQFAQQQDDLFSNNP